MHWRWRSARHADYVTWEREYVARSRVADWWEVDSEAGCVIGQRTGKRLKIGDPVRVAIAAIDLADRKLDLALAEGPASAISRTARLPKTGTKRGTRRVEKTAPATRRRTK